MVLVTHVVEVGVGVGVDVAVGAEVLVDVPVGVTDRSARRLLSKKNFVR